MALSNVQVQLTYSTSSTFTFDVDGEFSSSQECFYKDAADPPELTKIEEIWTITNARLVAASSELVFDEWNTFQGYVESRTAGIVGAKILRASSVERTLNAASHQEFKVLSVEVSADPEIPIATFQSVVPITITLQAVKVFPDGNGILDWDQTVSNTFRNGLHTLEWRTTIATAEGTDAGVKARQYASIPIDTFGNTYYYDTNGPDGIDIDYETAEESVSSPSIETTGDRGSSRVPTRCLAVSRISQLGIAVGAPTAGNSPNGPFIYSIEETMVDGITRVTTRAEANGPNALTWVKSRAPTVGVEEFVIYEDRANRNARGEWVTRSTEQNEPVKSQVQVVVSGGHRDIVFAPVAGDYPPVKLLGARQPYQLVMTATLRAVGASQSRDSMAFPAAPTSPWTFIPQLSSEDALPRLVKVGAKDVSSEWERSGTFVFHSPEAVEIGSLTPIFSTKAKGVPSYFILPPEST